MITLIVHWKVMGVFSCRYLACLQLQEKHLAYLCVVSNFLKPYCTYTGGSYSISEHCWASFSICKHCIASHSNIIVQHWFSESVEKSILSQAMLKSPAKSSRPNCATLSVIVFIISYMVSKYYFNFHVWLSICASMHAF